MLRLGLFLQIGGPVDRGFHYVPVSMNRVPDGSGLRFAQLLFGLRRGRSHTESVGYILEGSLRDGVLVG